MVSAAAPATTTSPATPATAKSCASYDSDASARSFHAGHSSDDARRLEGDVSLSELSSRRSTGKNDKRYIL